MAKRVKHIQEIKKSTYKEQDKKSSLLNKCWSYLDDNFHSFTEPNKIKISLELCKKDIPQEVKGDLFGSAEVAKAIAALTAADLASLINACRARGSETQPV
jgi:hypothetical protein